MSDLHALASAISPQSPAIRKFALAVADQLQPAPPPTTKIPHGVFSGLPSTDYGAVWDTITVQVPFTALFTSYPYVGHITGKGGKCWVNIPAGWDDATAAANAKNAAAQGPVLGFYIADDTDIDNGKTVSWLKARTQVIHAAVPGAVTVATHYSPQVIASLVGAVDEIGVDYYPARADGSFRLDIVKQCVAAAGARYSGVAGVSASNNTRVPTVGELQQNLAALAGGRSVFVYQWDDALTNNPALLAALKAWV